MNAKYFHDKLLSGIYNDAAVTIHHKDDESTWFDIYSSGKGFKYSFGKGSEEFQVQDLDGDDFERFSIVQILKSGYIVLNTDTETAVKFAISNIWNHINSFEDEYGDTVKGIPMLCGGSHWIGGLTDWFQYYAVNGIEVSLRTIPELCRINVLRKRRDLNSIPFIKTMNSNNSIYVNFVHIMEEGDYKETYAKCEEALQDLFSYMKQKGIDFKWVEIKMRKPAYSG